MRNESSVGSVAEQASRGRAVAAIKKLIANRSVRRRDLRRPKLRSTAGWARPEAAPHVAIIGSILCIGLAHGAACGASEAGVMRIGRCGHGANKFADLRALR